MTSRPELQKDANGLFPGEAGRGIPDFLRRAPVNTELTADLRKQLVNPEGAHLCFVTNNPTERMPWE